MKSESFKNKVFFDILNNRRAAFVDKVRSYIEAKGITIKNSSNKWKCDFWIRRESVEELYPNDKEGVAQFLAESINNFWIPVSIQYKTIRKKDTYTGNLTKIIIGRKYLFGKCNIRNCFQRLIFTNERSNRKIANQNRRNGRNGSSTVYPLDSVRRRDLKMALKNYMNIKSTSNLVKESIFIDFETVTDFQDNLNSFPESQDTSMIFMIGAGVFTNDGKWIYKSFTSNSLEQQDEFAIIKDFYEYLEEHAMEKKYIVHWSHAEPVLLRKIKDKWGLSIPQSYSFLDLMQPFKQVYVGQSVALKKIANNWKEMGYITTDYSNSIIADGLTAMAKIIQSWDANLLREIEEYNKKDTVVLSEIMKLLFS